MNITLRQLEIFSAVAAHGNVTRAAEELLLSQSAASMALSELETQLGEQLFTRSGRRLVLNEAGRALLPRAGELLDRAEEIATMFSSSDGRDAGQIRVGASSTIGNYLITDYLGRYSREQPQVEFSLEVGNTDQIISSLLDYSIDIGYIEGICRHPQLSSSVWRRDELVVFASPAHPLARRRKLTPTDLENAQWILREQGSGTREIFERALSGKVDRLHIAFEFGHTEAIKHAVKNNLGISCLSRLTVAELLQNRTLIALPTPFLDLTRNFYTLRHRQRYQTRILQNFTTFMDNA